MNRHDRMLPLGFRILWLGQLISNLGTQISLYALGLWLFRQHEQLVTFASIAVVVQLAKIAVMPLLGRYLARWSRRRVMLIANAVSSTATISLAFHLMRSSSSLALVLVCVALAAAAEATLLLCFSTLIPQLVSPSQLGRASGLFASCDGAIVMAAPFLGALLAASAGLVGVLVIDGLSSLVAAVCTLAVALPQCSSQRIGLKQDGGVRSAVAQLWSATHLRPLLMINTVVAGVLAAVEVAFPAWVVSAFGVGRLGRAMALAGVAFLLGSQLWRRYWALREACTWVELLRRALLVQGFILAAAALLAFQARVGVLVLIWFAGVSAYAMAVPLVLASLQGLWQFHVPPQQQTSLFAGRYTLEWLARLVALLGVGLLADHVFSPALARPGWPDWLLAVIGPGPGRSAALVLGLLGWAMIVPVLVEWKALGLSRNAI